MCLKQKLRAGRSHRYQAMHRCAVLEYQQSPERPFRRMSAVDAVTSKGGYVRAETVLDGGGCLTPPPVAQLTLLPDRPLA